MLDRTQDAIILDILKIHNIQSNKVGDIDSSPHFVSVLGFYGPVKTARKIFSQPVKLLVLFLGRLSSPKWVTVAECRYFSQ